MGTSEIIFILAISMLVSTVILYWTIRAAVATALRNVNAEEAGRPPE